MKKNIQCLAALLIGITIFYSKIIFKQGWFWEDLLVQFYPMKTFYAVAISQGYFPFWNPYVFSGMPFVGDVQNAAFYPLNFLLPMFVKNGLLSYLALELQEIFHILLGGIFIWLYARELKLSRTAGIVSSITFMFGAFLTLHIIHLPLVLTFIWFPLIMLFLHKAIRTNSSSNAIICGLIFGVSMLAGYPQLSLHMLYFMVFYTLFFVFIGKQDKKGWINYIYNLLIVVVVGVGIASIQYLPSYVYSLYTVRESMTYSDAVIHSLHPLKLITLFIPKFFGTVTGDSNTYWFSTTMCDYWETGIYVGILPLILAILGIRKSEKLTWFLGIAGLVVLLTMFGKYTPFFKFIWRTLPGLNKFRIPARFAGLFNFCIALLAGFGIDRLTKLNSKRVLKSSLVFFIILLTGWLIFYLGVFKRFFTPSAYQNIINQYGLFLLLLGTGLILIFLGTVRKSGEVITSRVVHIFIIFHIFIDLYIFGHNFVATSVNPYKFYAPNVFTNFLKEKQKEEISRANVRRGKTMLMPRNAGCIAGIELIEGYTPLKLNRYANFDIPEGRKFDLLNVKYELQIDVAGNRVGLAPRKSYLPRCWMAYHYVVAKNEGEVLRILNDPIFDYRNTIVLEETPAVNISIPDNVVSRQVMMSEHLPNRIKVDVKTPYSGFLVLSEIYYPLWKAFVDEKETPVYCVDYLLRAIFVPAGEHKVQFIYDPKYFKIGLVISILTIVLSSVALIFHKAMR